MGRFTGERRAMAAAVLAFYGFLYFIVAMQPMPGWAAAFSAMALVYGLGFFSVVAGYFWARWYAIGLGMSGLITAVFSMVQIGMEPVLMFYGGTHAFVSLALWGNGMSGLFDGRKEWRERFHLDENATHKLGKSVIRLGISLPYVVLYALAPRDDAGEALFALAAGAVAVSGLVGMIRMRGWSVLALVAGTGMIATSVLSMSCGADIVSYGDGYAINVWAAGLAALVAMGAALAPMAKPLVRYLRG